MKNQMKVKFMGGKAVIPMDEVKKHTVLKRELLATLQSMKNLPVDKEFQAEHYSNFIVENLGLTQHLYSQRLLLVAKRFNKPCSELRETEDKNVEWQCSHKVRHIIYSSRKGSKQHQCCVKNCCQNLKMRR